MKSIFNYFLENKLVVNMLMIFVLIIGAYSLMNLRQEETPEVEINIMTISAIYPGSSPSDVEINAVEPIERKLATISGIDHYTSLSLEGKAIISLELDSDVADIRAVKDEIYRNISLSSIPELPPEVENIHILDFNPKLKDVISFVIYPKDGMGVTEAELYDYSRDLADELLRVDGVSEVRKFGWREREIHVEVNPEKAGALDVSLIQIVNSIKTRNIRSTGGTLQSLSDEKTIVTISQFENPLDVRDVIIRSNFTGKRVRVENLADVFDTFKETSTKVTVNGKTGVLLEIVKKENADIVETVDNVREYMEGRNILSNSRFDFDIVRDRSIGIKSLLGVVQSNAILGFILIIIVLLIFLDRKTAFWTAMGLPISLAMVFTFMMLTDMSLNRITLIAIIAVIGMLVDDGIVIAERIFEKKREGLSALQAAREGVASVISPVIVSIVTTIVAFLPMLTIGGIMGEFIRVFPIVVTAMLLVSLFEATFMLPNHLSHGKIRKIKKANWFDSIKNGYGKFLKLALRFRYIVALLFVGLFIFSLSFSKETISNFVLMPSTASDVIHVDLEAAEGTSLERMTELTTEIERAVLKNVPDDALVSTKATIGKHEGGFLGSKGEYEHWSTITINLTPINDRDISAGQIIKQLRKVINKDKYPHFEKLLLAEKRHGPPMGEPVDVKIIGNDLEKSKLLMIDLAKFLRSIDGVKNVRSDIIDGKKELEVVLRYERLAELGLTAQDVAQTVRIAYDGMIATSIETSDELLDFRVKVDDSFQKDEAYILSLMIPNNRGRLIRLSDVAYLEEGIGKGNVNHYDGNRSISLSAKVDNKIITSAQANMKVLEYYKSIAEKHPGIRVEIEGEAKSTKETLGDVVFAYLLAIILIFTVLILLFKSVTQPIQIILVIPFGIIGALVAFTLHGMPLSFMGIIGIIGLSGVVVNDSVIMVDFINGIFRKKQSTDKKVVITSIVDGAKERLRPVLLTTITTVAGLFPTVYGFLGESEMIAPVAMAMAYGLIFATTLTLLLTPSMYMIHNDIRGLFSSKKRG